MSMQIVELLYKTSTKIDCNAIRERADALLDSGIELPKSESGSAANLFFHTKSVITYRDDKTMPAQTVLMGTGKKFNPEQYAKYIEQSWRCPDAADRLGDTVQSQVLTEMMSQGLSPQERVRLFHGMLQATVELTQPDALVFMHTGQVIAPEDYLGGCNEDAILRPGTLNVRFYNISNSDVNDMLMDTRGMEEIGLHDLQCHFRNLEVNDMAKVLYNTAVYIFENGAVIESGQTIQGIEAGSRWTCQFEESLLDPKCDVLDINPGQPFAAGNRA